MSILNLIPEWGCFIYCLADCESTTQEQRREIMWELLDNPHFNVGTNEEMLQKVKDYLVTQMDIDDYLYITGKIERDELRVDKLF